MFICIIYDPWPFLIYFSRYYCSWKSIEKIIRKTPCHMRIQIADLEIVIQCDVRNITTHLPQPRITFSLFSMLISVYTYNHRYYHIEQDKLRRCWLNNVKEFIIKRINKDHIFEEWMFALLSTNEWIPHVQM